MTIDASLVPILEGLAAQGVTTFEAMGAEGARAAIGSFTAMQAPGAGVERVLEEQYGPTDEQRLRVYVPAVADRPLPVVVYVHGGGFIGGDLPLIDGIARNLAADLPAVAVAVTYRRAPESVFPAAHDDVREAVAWVRANIAEYGGDPTRIAVAGDSAGGTLVTALALNDPEIAAVALVYPLIDPWGTSPTRAEFADGPVLTDSDLRWFGDTYVPDAALRDDPRIRLDRAPAEQLASFPPLLVVTNEIDPLRGEGEEFAAAVKRAGGPAEVQRLPGLIHAAFWLSGPVPRSAEYHEALLGFLRPIIAPEAAVTP